MHFNRSHEEEAWLFNNLQESNMHKLVCRWGAAQLNVYASLATSSAHTVDIACFEVDP